METALLLSTLIKMAPPAIQTAFKPFQLQIKRAERIGIMKKLLLPVLNAEREKLLQTFNQTPSTMKLDDLYRLSHLRLLDMYSEFQLEQQLYLLKDKTLNERYINELLTLMISSVAQNKPNEALGEMFANLQSTKTNEIDMDVTTLNRALDDFFVDEEKTLDGLTFSRFRSVLYFGSTIQDLKKLGLKYHINIPGYISKVEIQKRFKEALSQTNQWTEDKAMVMQQASLKKLYELGGLWGINAKTYMTKEEMIEYILQYAEASKPYYEKPVDESIYYQEIITQYLKTHEVILGLQPELIRIVHQHPLELALKEFAQAGTIVQEKLKREKMHLDALYQRLLALIKAQEITADASNHQPFTQPALSMNHQAPTPENQPSVQTIPSTMIPINHTTDLKPYLDRIDQSLQTQQQLFGVIHELIKQNKGLPVERTVIEKGNQTNSREAPTTNPITTNIHQTPWYQRLQVFDLILGAILLIQILLFLFWIL